MSKTMYLLRHADRVGERLTERGISEAREFGRALGDRPFTIVHSPLPWAWRTVSRIIPVLEAINIQGEDLGLSPAGLSEEMFTPAVESRIGEWRVPALNVIGEAFGGEQVARWEAVLADGVRKIFEGLPPAGVCIAIGHDPYIQLAARGLGAPVPEDMARLSSFCGFRITRENSGRILAQPFRWPEETP